MEIANIMVGLGGDRGNTVPKYGVTPSEIAVIRSIHGEDAVFDIEPIGEVNRPHREERARLLAQYGKAMDGNQNSIVANLFPGAAAPMFDTLDALELPDVFFKTATRVSRKAPTLAPVEEVMPEGLNAAQKKAWVKEQAAKAVAAKKAVEEAAAKAAEETLANDGIEELPAPSLFE